MQRQRRRGALRAPRAGTARAAQPFRLARVRRRRHAEAKTRTTSRKSVNEKQAAIVAGIVVAPRVIKRVDTIYAETILKTFFADDALRTIYREKAARIRGASGTSIARLAAIRSSIANVRPKLQRLILETVAVKPLLATGFGAQAGRIHSDFRRRVRRVTRVNDWTSD